MAKHIETGKRGEDIATIFLEKKGYEILARNWRYSRSEIDIIAKHNDILIFVEVKTRSDDYFGKPELFVTAKKQKLMARAAPIYMDLIKHNWEIRFDVVSVLIRHEKDIYVEHLEDAFFPGL